MCLFFTHEHVDRGAVEVPCISYLVLQIAAVGFLDPLRQIAEEDEGWNRRALEHRDILDFDKFTLVGRWRISGDRFEHHGVEL